MQTPETNGETDYIYYPIAYPNMLFGTLIASIHPGWSECWIELVDKTKFLDGLGGDYAAGYPDLNVFNILSLGF